jgi:DNA-binding transcriptional MerR regulator
MPELTTSPGQGSAPISMRVIIQRSGVTRQTIHFYLRKGLLPKPRRTSRTFALYSPETVQLLQLIKESQTEFRLSLHEIVKIFVAADYDPIQIRGELQRRNAAVLRESVAAGPGDRQLTEDEVVARLQPEPPPGWLDELRRRSLLNGGNQRFSGARTELVSAIWGLCQVGAELNNLEEAVKTVTPGVEAEVSEFQRIINLKRHGNTDYASAIDLLNALELFVKCKHVEVLNAIFFRKIAPAASTIVGPNQKRVVPSESFLVRMGLNREIDRLLHRFDKDQEDRRTLRDLCRSYHLRSDWLNLFGVTEALLRLDPADVRGIADQTRAMYYLGRIDEAVTKLEARLRLGSDPLLKFRLGQSLVLRAKDRGVRELFNAIRRKQTLTAEALSESRDRPNVRRWITLDYALDNLSVSDPLQLNPPAIKDLEALYEEYQSIPDRPLSPLSKMSLAVGKILTAYALHLTYRRQQDPKAEKLRLQIIRMDPHCILAARGKERHARNGLGKRKR